MGSSTPDRGGISERFSMMKLVYLKNTSMPKLRQIDRISQNLAFFGALFRYFPMGKPVRYATVTEKSMTRM